MLNKKPNEQEKLPAVVRRSLEIIMLLLIVLAIRAKLAFVYQGRDRPANPF